MITFLQEWKPDTSDAVWRRWLSYCSCFSHKILKIAERESVSQLGALFFRRRRKYFGHGVLSTPPAVQKYHHYRMVGRPVLLHWRFLLQRDTGSREKGLKDISGKMRFLKIVKGLWNILFSWKCQQQFAAGYRFYMSCRFTCFSYSVVFNTQQPTGYGEKCSLFLSGAGTDFHPRVGNLFLSLAMVLFWHPRLHH